MLDSDQASHYPGETAIRIDYIQLGKAHITCPCKLTHHSLGSPFALFEDEFGLSRKAQGMADTRSFRLYLQAWLVPHPSTSCSPPRDAIHGPTVSLRMRYLALRLERVIQPLCEGTFNLNQGQTMVRSLTDIDGIKEYMPSRHQQQP